MGQNYKHTDPVGKVLQTMRKVQDTFMFSDEDLELVCGITLKYAKACDSYIDTPSREELHRLFELFVIALDWSDNGFKKVNGSVKSPYLKGRSAFDLLLENPLDKEKILFVGSRMLLTSMVR